MAGYLITATDTDAGKTHVATMLVHFLREAGVNAVGFKPVSCGDLADAEGLWEASERVVSLEEICPIALQTPAAPSVAGEIEGVDTSVKRLLEGYHHLASQFEVVIVEGVGGWEVPLTAKESFPDFAKALGLPVVCVTANRLGALNHTILTTKAILREGLDLKGVILNCIEEEQDVATVTNRAQLETFLSTPILGEIIYDAPYLEEGLYEALISPFVKEG